MILGGLVGVWITQFIFMIVNIIFAYKTALFFGNKYVSFWGVICSFTVFQQFFYEVAGPDEYTVPFMMISLYIFTKFFFTKKDPPIYELIILGICFATSVFIRINHFPLWLGFCVVILIESLQKRSYFPLLKYVLFFLLGILIVTIPLISYLYINNAFSDYIHQNIIIGGSRGFTGFGILGFTKSFILIMEKGFCYVPLFVFYIWIYKKQKEINIYLSFALLLSYLLTIFFFAIIRTSFAHYNMLLVPFLVPAFVFCVKTVFGYFAIFKFKKLILLVLFCFVFFKDLLSWVIAGYETIKDTSRNELILTGKKIDQNTDVDDTIIFLGRSSIYLFTERQSASRYIYQISGIRYDPNAQGAFLHDLQENDPKIIVIGNNDGQYAYFSDWYSHVYSMMENEYRLLSSEDGHFLFIRE
jgi:hypothetical protein